MRIKLGSALWPLIILSIALIIIIVYVPETWVRAVIGLPFILFTPGYSLITVLFPQRSKIGGIERVALSIGLSFAVVALLGLGLNYTPWGITLWSSIIATGSFVLLLTIVAEFRRYRLPSDERFSVEINFSNISLGENTLSRILSVILILAVIGTIGTLIYTVTNPKTGEVFTEFYILGINGEAADYPSSFVLSDGGVISVTYGDDFVETASVGKITIGIINREQQETIYEVMIEINGEQIDILADSNAVDKLGPINLQNDESYESEIGFAPSYAGDDQRMDFILLVDGQQYFDDPLHIWIDIIEE